MNWVRSACLQTHSTWSRRETDGFWYSFGDLLESLQLIMKISSSATESKIFWILKNLDQMMMSSWKHKLDSRNFNRNNEKKPDCSDLLVQLKLLLSRRNFHFLQFITKLMKLTSKKFVRLHPFVYLHQGTVDGGMGSSKHSTHFWEGHQGKFPEKIDGRLSGFEHPLITPFGTDILLRHLEMTANP